MNKKIKWGIIGCGHIAKKFAADLATIKDADLYAVASRNQFKAKSFAQEFNSKIFYGSYKDLAYDSNIDAVYIATPHPFHKENSILCLQQKKAVLCEKPFAMNAEEVEEMITVAKENNVLLMEALWTYFLPHYQYVLDIFESKKLGELKEIRADFGFKVAYDLESRLVNKDIGGGSLLDIGIYPIFLALSTLGVPDEVKANATFFDTGADSSCTINFSYKNAKANLKSTLIEDTETAAIFTFDNAIVKINRMFHKPSTVTVITKESQETINFGCTTFGYNFEIEHFNQLLRENKKESDIMTFEFSKKLIKMLDDVRKIIGFEY